MAMTKRDLVVRIAKESGLAQQDVYAVLQKSLDYIVEALANQPRESSQAFRARLDAISPQIKHGAMRRERAARLALASRL